MNARVLTGSKQEIAEKLAEIEGDIREAIVFIEEPWAEEGLTENIFADMEPFTVRQPVADDSRDAVYRRMEGE
jgi:hypothetical protein